MREGIHPKYSISTVTCACGNTFQTRSVVPEYHLEICSECHPFFTGKQRLMDSAGRVEKFTKRFEKTAGKTLRVAAKKRAAAVKTASPKVMSTSARKVNDKKEVTKKEK